jgi:hypothetical protein
MASLSKDCVMQGVSGWLWLSRAFLLIVNVALQVTGSVGNLVEKHSAAITAEKKQIEAARRAADKQLQQQVGPLV